MWNDAHSVSQVLVDRARDDHPADITFSSEIHFDPAHVSGQLTERPVWTATEPLVIDHPSVCVRIAA
jgi:hypothetical protein